MSAKTRSPLVGSLVIAVALTACGGEGAPPETSTPSETQPPRLADKTPSVPAPEVVVKADDPAQANATYDATGTTIQLTDEILREILPSVLRETKVRELDKLATVLEQQQQMAADGRSAQGFLGDVGNAIKAAAEKVKELVGTTIQAIKDNLSFKIVPKFSAEGIGLDFEVTMQQPNGAGTATVTGSVTIALDGTVTITVNPALAGWEMLAWSGNSPGTLDGNLSVTATGSLLGLSFNVSIVGDLTATVPALGNPLSGALAVDILLAGNCVTLSGQVLDFPVNLDYCQ